MSYGMQISASGALAAIHRQDSLTANLANINTVGFKPVMTGAMFRDSAKVEDHLQHLPSDDLLERLGGGVFAAPTGINFAQGALTETGNPFDLAIQGDGFFVVGNAENPTLTRDGRMTLDDDGKLVLAASGTPVLDTQNRPITIDESAGSVLISADGTISQNGASVAQIQIGSVPDRDQLVKLGHGMFANPSGAPLTILPGSGRIEQFTVESSAVNEIDALMKIQAASRSAQGNIGMIDMQNRLLDSLINRFARTA